ncbi:single-stranded-DNA-specific exonuclease RecJ [Sinimarinibacterium sp. NLF-5-8]|uniref:single-stranded-DNA-specific exonuclease RecJ n=1 Tax=Sinimarinibacterium sp. NLF-5-8 TaxID=2698684 RepID=UPI00137BA85A|nr:single-stranded-DNA-specific exonuclease RecJ [Sinimarinibacterium sp. NLF-5-8]QHS09392.1 single-stranded-DNA-specific exonuclease RecJ [Sinimarinibacterium sp. NLF-5-8]
MILRQRAPGDVRALPADLHPVLRRLYAARGVQASELALELKHLLPPSDLKGIDDAARALADAIQTHQPIVISGDYDADGATGTALGVLGLRALGATQVSYVVPDRFKMGYGLSEALAELAAATGARVLVTVDSGISSVAGVARAQALGMQVIVTDHHLAGSELPRAQAIVNPNQPGCGFASKNLAGVGVMFYVLLATRAELRARGAFAQCAEPNLAEFLDLVAVGTVADVVKLDYNNRILVQQGLLRMRRGHMRPGLAALLQVARRSTERLNAQDFGFAIGPRINAAGRLDDIRTGIDCLLAETLAAALPLAQQLDEFNRNRRSIEAQMNDDALDAIVGDDSVGLCLFGDDWHEGVVGIVAGRLKERLHRPVIAFARAQEPGLLKGSGRTIPGLHLRDALAAIDAQYPGLIERFGGHAMAAGLSLRMEALDAFKTVFDEQCRAMLTPQALQQVIETDGALAEDELTLPTAQLLEHAGPWGQGFAEPLFEGEFAIHSARAVGSDGSHIKYLLRSGNELISAIDFGGAERMQTQGRIYCAYSIGVNRWQGSESVDLRLMDVRAA